MRKFFFLVFLCGCASTPQVPPCDVVCICTFKEQSHVVDAVPDCKKSKPEVLKEGHETETVQEIRQRDPFRNQRSGDQT